jgi:hypothetical protein
VYGCGQDLASPGWGPVTGYSEHSGEDSGPIKDGEFLEQLSDCLLFKKDSSPCSLCACTD